jgi:hypothetical protein
MCGRTMLEARGSLTQIGHSQRFMTSLFIPSIVPQVLRIEAAPSVYRRCICAPHFSQHTQPTLLNNPPSSSCRVPSDRNFPRMGQLLSILGGALGSKTDTGEMWSWKLTSVPLRLKRLQLEHSAVLNVSPGFDKLCKKSPSH